MKKIKGSLGFTLIEILIAVSIMAVLGVAVTSTLVQGSRIYTRFSQISSREQTSFLLEKLTHDLRNSVAYSPVETSYKADTLVFSSAVLQGAADLSKTQMPSRVQYRYIPSQHTLVRSASAFPYTNEAATDRWILPEGSRVVFTPIGDPKPVAPFLDVSLRMGSESGPEIKKMIEIPAGYEKKS